MRVYAMVLPPGAVKKLSRPFRGLGGAILEYLPELKSDLVLSQVDMKADEYIIGSMLSAAILGFFMFLSTYTSLIAFELAPEGELMLAMIPSVFIAFLNLFILLRYPRILAVKRAEIVDKDLIYALKDLLLNISAGLSLFESVKRVAEADHGLVSGDFLEVVEDTNRGMPLDDALENLALKSSSDFMRNSIWQIVNAVKSGTSIKAALSGIIEALERDQNRKIRNYIQELNVLTMVYMLFAIAVPTIITTVLVVLTSLAGTGVTEEIYLFVILVCLLVQIMLVGFIRSRRPLIYAAN
jgi:pilus assembly protein TadC